MLWSRLATSEDVHIGQTASRSCDRRAERALSREDKLNVPNATRRKASRRVEQIHMTFHGVEPREVSDNDRFTAEPELLPPIPERAPRPKTIEFDPIR